MRWRWWAVAVPRGHAHEARNGVPALRPRSSAGGRATHWHPSGTADGVHGADSDGQRGFGASGESLRAFDAALCGFGCREEVSGAKVACHVGEQVRPHVVVVHVSGAEPPRVLRDAVGCLAGARGLVTQHVDVCGPDAGVAVVAGVPAIL